MNGIDLDRMARLAELLALAFYGLMMITLATVLSGALGFGFLFLLLGSTAHVCRAGLEEFVARHRARPERPAAKRRAVPSRSRSRPKPERSPRRPERAPRRSGRRPAAAPSAFRPTS